LVTILGCLLQGLGEDALNLTGNVGLAGVGILARGGIASLRRRLSYRLSSTSQHFTKHDAKREDVALPIDSLPEQLFRRHVIRCPSGAGLSVDPQ
jgi:hypothetical protein